MLFSGLVEICLH